MKGAIFAIAAAAGTAQAAQSAYGQCGGQGWSGQTSCVSGYFCQYSNPYYSQCVPGTASTTAGSAPTSTKPMTTTATSVKPTTTSASPPTTTSAKPTSGGKVQYAGVNIAGFDFGCGTDGTCDTTKAYAIGTDGINQMNHFVKDDKLNAFRLPVGWQWLVNNNLGGTLDSNNFAKYDTLMQGCLNSGAALCILDVHNYARYNGQIIGQGGPTNAQFASLWSQLAKKYANNNKVAFGIMNEPHDVNINTWAQSVQAAVTAIRQAGATSNKILLPGNDYTSAAQFISNGSYAALSTVKNLDGSFTNLIFDVHKYLDSDNSGTHSNCVTDNSAAFTSLAQTLRSANRQAILSETGGGPTDSSCLQYLCSEFDTLNANSDVYLGWTAWAAGGFDQTYTLTLTPKGSVGSYTDQPLLTQCVAGKFH